MINLEPLGDGTITDRNFQTLRRLVLDTGGISARIRFGTIEFEFTASAESTPVTQPHGLGKAPILVIVTNWWDPGVNDGTGHVDPGSFTDTSFDCFSRANTAPPGTYTVTTGWVAIG